MSILPVLTGVWATLLASVQLACWISLGSFFVPAVVEEEAGVPATILIGSAITTAVYAVFASWGKLPAAFALNFVLCTGALLLRQARCRASLRWIAASLANLCRGRRWAAVTCGTILAIYWIVSIAPPRDADVMRYHLAHIRQILAEGSWQPIADYHYALPFGWSMNYLPFEALHLPQGAQLLNLELWVITMAILSSVLRRFHSATVVLLAGALFVAAPQMMKAATSAHADMFIAFSVVAIAAIALRLPNLGIPEWGLLGFTAWIAANTRYQGLGLGLAVTLIVLGVTVKRRIQWRPLFAYAAGTAAALMLSAPFYWFNYRAFHNPVWPIAVPFFNGASRYADRVAAFYTASLTGHLSASSVVMGIFNLLRRPDVFPLPLFIVLLPFAYLIWRPYKVRYIVAIVSAFFVLWTLSQPVLFYRYSTMLTPLVVLGWAPILMSWPPRWYLNRALKAGLVVVIVAAGIFQLIYFRHFLEYAVTGNETAFHRFTWFYEPYQWANRETALDSKFLVMVTFGETYYLDRPYRRADPWASGVIDWPSIGTPEQLDRVLSRGGYQYVIYEDKDWSPELGGTAMRALMEKAIETGTLREVAKFQQPLNSIGVLSELGLRPQTTLTNVRILQLSSGTNHNDWAKQGGRGKSNGGSL